MTTLGHGGISPRIFNLGTTCSCKVVISFTVWPLEGAKSPRYPLGKMLGGRQIRTEGYVWERNLVFLRKIEPQLSDRQACILITIQGNSKEK
jgi:hypothetical protein